MAVIQSIDGPNRRIYLHADTVGQTVHPIDIYREMRTFRRQDETLRPFDLFLLGAGNIQKTSSTSTERYVICSQGTRIVPYDADQTLTINGTIITDDGQSGTDCFDKSSLVNTVDIHYEPPQVEVISVNTGSGLTIEQATMLTEIFQRFGLDKDNPITFTPTQISFGGKIILLTGDGKTTKTATRQP